MGAATQFAIRVALVELQGPEGLLDTFDGGDNASFGRRDRCSRILDGLAVGILSPSQQNDVSLVSPTSMSTILPEGSLPTSDTPS